MRLHAKSRVGLYEVEAIYENGVITVNKGGFIRMPICDKYVPSSEIAIVRNDTDKVSEKGVLKTDAIFSSLSSAASFVAGRSSNGMIFWKTEDGEYVGKTLKPDKYN